MEKGVKFFILTFFLLLLFVNITKAAEFTHVISNSDNWRDVYSSMMFATFSNAGSDFLVSTRHGPLLMMGLSKSSNYLIVSSERRAYVINYPALMRANGFENVEEKSVANANLELILDLPEIKNFIIVGNTYGYNGIAVAPYAVIKKSWVFFVDKNNIDEVDSFLNTRNPDEVLIYGFVDREVRDSLAKYNPEIIDTGDRFKDNTLIVDKYLKINPSKQAVLTNGEFIEKEIMNGVEPVLFTGKENVPEQIGNYIKNSDFEVGVLIGSDLVGAATNIRRSTGISVIVKFARGARQPAGTISNVEGLDLFYLPTPIVNLKLHSARYNKAINQLEITYKSESNVPIFFKGTITYVDENGDSLRTGDADAIFISPNDYKTMNYKVDVNANNLSLNIFTLYGDTPSSLDKILEANINAEIINVIDGCELEITKLRYNKVKSEFLVYVKNLADIVCYADAEILNVKTDNTEKTLGTEGSIKIGAKAKEKLAIPYVISEEDLEKNDYLDVIVYYGEKEDSLVKIVRGKFALEIQTFSFVIMLIIIATIIALLILFLLWKRRKKKEENFDF